MSRNKKKVMVWTKNKCSKILLTPTLKVIKDGMRHTALWYTNYQRPVLKDKKVEA